MKKTFYAAFIFAAFGMTACGEQTENAEETTEEETTEVEEVTTENYSLNAEESSLEWRAAWVMPTEDGALEEAKHHTGTINVTDGSVAVTGEEVKGDFNIDLTSIEVTDLGPEDGKGNLEAHLMGKDEEKDPNHFFNTNEYTTAKVHVKEVVDGMAHVVLSVIGIEVEQKVEVETSMEGDKMMMHGEFDFDMSELGFAMTEPNPEEGNINPTIGFKLHLVLDKQ
jgi:hypothetical protein